MYERKIPIDYSCGIKVAMEAIGGKWKCCIIFDLRNGAKRPSELQKLYPEANPRVINQQLRELCECGIIEKTVYPEIPPRTEYSLTDAGRSVLPLLTLLDEWGNKMRPYFEK